MSEPHEIYWNGESGTKYQFWIYDRGTTFREPCPGIYLHAKQLKPHRWVPVYIGQTENINARSPKRQLRECVDHHGATHIHVRIVEGEDDRVAEEKDLLQKWKTPCNRRYSS